MFNQIIIVSVFPVSHFIKDVCTDALHGGTYIHLRDVRWAKQGNGLCVTRVFITQQYNDKLYSPDDLVLVVSCQRNHGAQHQGLNTWSTENVLFWFKAVNYSISGTQIENLQIQILKSKNISMFNWVMIAVVINCQWNQLHSCVISIPAVSECNMLLHVVNISKINQAALFSAF